ncbi:MAG: DUF4190 domain-containing protein [Alphaproteobacteria bacterium]|nr:DUF4190 domain-containing protein [Alphaproteobacteria bacterium]
MADQSTPGEAGRPSTMPSQQSAPTTKVGFGVTALVLGIVAVFLCWIPLFGLILPILALIFGGIGIYLQNGRGMAIAGLVLGLITFVINLGFLLFAMNRAVTG